MRAQCTTHEDSPFGAATRVWKQHTSHYAPYSSEAARKLQPPHGNTLVDLMLPEDQKQAAINSCTKEMDLSDRNACDVELLVVGCALTDRGFASKSSHINTVASHPSPAL